MNIIRDSIYFLLPKINSAITRVNRRYSANGCSSSVYLCWKYYLSSVYGSNRYFNKYSKTKL